MKVTKPVLAALTLVVALSLTACGGTGTASGGTSTTASSVDAAAGLATATAKAKAAQDVSTLKFSFPADKVTMGKKRVMVISQGQQSLLASAFAKWESEAAVAAGWDVSPIMDGGLDNNKMANFIQQAISEKYDGVLYASTDPHAITAAINAAAAAKIPLACMSCSNVDFEKTLIAVASNPVDQGEVVAAQIISSTKGKAKILEFPDAAYPTVIKRIAAMNAYFAKNCPGCTVEQTPFSAANLFKPGPPEFTAALASHAPGTITNVVAPYGTPAVAFAKTAQSAGRTDFTIGSADVTSDLVLQISRKVLPLTSAPIPANEFLAWTTVDLLGRAMAGVPGYESQSYPVGLATADNAATFLPDGIFQPGGLDYKAKFKSLWK